MSPSAPEGAHSNAHPQPGEHDGTDGAQPDEGSVAGRHRLPAPRGRLRRARRFFRRRTVRVISALIGVFVVWAAFSAGQATFQNNGQGAAANLAEWARSHHLGPIVTFGEWLSYNPPKVGGEPGMSLAVPKGEQIAPVRVTKAKHHKEFAPDIPAALKSLAGTPVPGEGQWRVVEKVQGEPAILTTFLRDATYTSYVNGIASLDQRLVRLYLRPGYEDPGYGKWNAPYDVPAGSRKDLLATFNSGFKIADSQGGFYLNGARYDSLVNGSATIVYYKNGTIKIGEWGRDFAMNPAVAGVRQNLKLLIDRGEISPDLDQDVETSWGATLGGGYFVWRSGLGITRDGRIVYVYGPALDVQDLAELLRRAGAVEGMQLDINPAWMKFDYYRADEDPSDPAPAPLLPAQQSSPFSFYTPSTRDFTVVYAR